MRIHILGLGPIGCMLAHNLRRALPVKHTITLIHKTAAERRQLIKKERITVESNGNQTLSGPYLHEVSSKQLDSIPKPPTTPVTPEEKAQHTEHIESLFVALKSQQTTTALKDLAGRLNSDSTVVLFQNGLGIYEQLISQVFRNPTQRPQFIIASNTHGAYVKHLYHVVHAGVGSIEFGIAPDPRGRDYEAGLYDETAPLSERRLRMSDIKVPGERDVTRYKTLQDTVAALLLLRELNTTWKSLAELRIIMQRKLVVNAAINPLTAIFGCRNGDIFQNVIGRNILRNICAEASAVYAAEIEHDNQLELQRLQEEGVDTTQIQLPSLPPSLTTQALEEYILQIGEYTSGNVSSMLQDVQRGRKTEIEYINGYLKTMGEAYGVPTPVNTTLRDMVRLKYYIPIDQFI